MENFSPIVNEQYLTTQWELTTFFQNSLSLPRWLYEMDCFRCANWGLHVSGHGVLPLATGKKYKKLTKPPES